MSGMLREARREFARLGRDESGVALMLTLGVILVLYVLCAGVYSIGETVRQKIELQNICDSAAYSAALTQADGLSRMAMVNRAMSWTYVQLTNAQLDYITYRWMKKVRDNFKKDRDSCESWNDGTFGVCAYSCCDLILFSKYKGENKGWFCGLADLDIRHGRGKIRMNGNREVKYDELSQAVDSMSSIEGYGESIRNMRTMISAYNVFLPAINNYMLSNIVETACTVLVTNLPKKSAVMDVEAVKDMLWIVRAPYAGNPYGEDESGGRLYNPRTDSVMDSYFRPLLNTEADERIFLSMADNVNYDRLEPYFSNGDPQQYESGGLDQWFIRGFARESADGASTSVPHDWYESHLAHETLGICRVYKNTNRKEFPVFRRCHHINASTSIATGLFSATPLNIDVPPSCAHMRALYPEQCATVEESTALYADYDWCSFQMHWACWPEGKLGILHHTDFGLIKDGILSPCPHLCKGPCISPFSHKRSSYKPCFINPIKLVQDEWDVRLRDQMLVHPVADLPKLMENPYGHARIYGDDKDLYEEDTYTGVPAKPWLLGQSFFGRKGGAILVGLARRQRNPWQWLLNFGKSKSSTQEKTGIYSAFDPTDDGYMVAFSAARAAFRHSASPGGVRDYETRYDSVCHNALGNSKLELDGDDGFGCGCPCNNDKNLNRLNRCWNLCTSDWDATLLPLAYAYSSGTEYDSMAPGESEWESIKAREDDDDPDDPYQWNPFVWAARALYDKDSDKWVGWSRFLDSTGSLSPDAEKVPGDFLWMSAPGGMQGGKHFNLVDALNRRVL